MKIKCSNCGTEYSIKDSIYPEERFKCASCGNMIERKIEKIPPIIYRKGRKKGSKSKDSHYSILLEQGEKLYRIESFTKFTKWMSEGRISLKDRFSIAGGEWRKVEDIPLFRNIGEIVKEESEGISPDSLLIKLTERERAGSLIPEEVIEERRIEKVANEFFSSKESIATEDFYRGKKRMIWAFRLLLGVFIISLVVLIIRSLPYTGIKGFYRKMGEEPDIFKEEVAKVTGEKSKTEIPMDTAVQEGIKSGNREREDISGVIPRGTLDLGKEREEIARVHKAIDEISIEKVAEKGTRPETKDKSGEDISDRSRMYKEKSGQKGAAIEEKVEKPVIKPVRSYIESVGSQKGSSLSTIKRLRWNGQYQEALKIVREEMITSPSDSRLFEEAGWIYIGLNNFMEAEKSFKKAISLSPNYPQAYHGLGIVYMKKGEKKKALDAYRRCLALSPNYDKKAEVKAFIRNLEVTYGTEGVKEEMIEKKEEIVGSEKKEKQEESGTDIKIIIPGVKWE